MINRLTCSFVLTVLWAPIAVAQIDSAPTETTDRGGYGISNPAPLTGTIFTGRPSFSTGPNAVPVGRTQFEFGYTYANRPGGRNDDVHSFPNTLLRFGIYRDIELRLSTGGYLWREAGKDGTTDLRLGAKIEVRDQDGWVPKMAVQPSFKVPVGNASNSNDPDPMVELVAVWNLSDEWSLLMNASLAAVSDDDDDTESVFAYSASLGRSVMESAGVFVEYFGVFPGDETGAHSVDWGVTVLLTEDLQLDAAVGFGLNDEADDLFTTTGFSFRF